MKKIKIKIDFLFWLLYGLENHLVNLKMIKDFPFLSLQRSFGEPDMEILSVILEVMVASEIDFKPLSGIKPKLFSSMKINKTYSTVLK